MDEKKSELSLVDQAIARGVARRLEQEAELTQEAKTRRHYENHLEVLVTALLPEIQKLHGTKTRVHGELQVDPRADFRFNTIATVQTADGRPVAWFKAGVIHGTMDGSDDCRDIPYTTVRAWARVYPPGNIYQDMDTQELKPGNNGGSEASCGDVKELPEFLSKIAGYLAAWF